MLRANCSVIVRSRPPVASGTVVPVVPERVMPELSRIVTRPASAPQKTTSRPSLSGAACFSTGASGVPAQRALPMPPVKNGKPVFPEHSRVKSSSRRWRDRRSRRVSVCGRATRPSMPSCQVAAAMAGWL